MSIPINIGQTFICVKNVFSAAAKFALLSMSWHDFPNFQIYHIQHPLREDGGSYILHMILDIFSGTLHKFLMTNAGKLENCRLRVMVTLVQSSNSWITRQTHG